MFSRIIISLVLVLSYLQSVAQYDVAGTLSNIENKNEPLADHPVYFFIDTVLIDTIYTDVQGVYSFYYDGELSGTLYVKTVGFCDTWNVYMDSVIRSSKDITIIDFDICHLNSDDACFASFDYEHIDSVTINFSPIYNLEQLMDYEWDFGDENNGSSLQNPQYQYADQGIYTVQLVTTNPLGCTDTSVNEVLVSEDTYIRGGLAIPGNTLYDAHVQLINYDDNTIEKTVYADLEGNYQFWCNPGKYYLKIIPDTDFDDFPRVIPTYYGTTTNWKNALVTPDAHDIIDINLQALTSYFFPNGYNNITVTLEASINMDLLPVDVILLDQNKNPLDYGVEVQYGYYEFAELPEGIYYVVPECPGRNSDTVKVEFEWINDNDVFIEFEMNSTEFNAVGIDDLVQNDNRFNAYPIPVKDQLTINSELPVSKINVIDASGRIVSENSYSFQNNCILNTHQWPRGVYFLTVFYDNQPPGSQKVVK
jgi:PKD repeat protein